MIFIRYLVSIMLRHQLIVFLVLVLVFFSQRFIRVLHLVMDGGIPKFSIFVFLVLSIPEIMKLVLPMSLFIGILITFNYLHINNEIVAMYSCGLGNSIIIRGVLFLSSITMIFSIINVLFLSPFCLRYQAQLMLKYQSDFNVVKLVACQFQFLKRMHSVYFIDNFHEKYFEGIFFIQNVPNDHFSIIVADRGCVERSFDGRQWIVLGSGKCYFWNNGVDFCSNFFINSFDQYKILIDRNSSYFEISSNDLVSEMFIGQLWCNSALLARVELHWRLTLVFVVFIMAMIIFPLSVIKLHNNYLLSVILAIVLYLVFFLLQIFLRSYVSKGYIDLIWIWIVNACYVFIAVVLNFWNSVVFRNFRWKLRLFCINIWD